MSRPSRPFDLDQARRRAKESLAALRVTQPDARLADAQHALAREHGYRTWPDLVRDTERFDVVEPDAVPWSRVTRVTVVCFVGDAPDAPVALHRHDDGTRLPHRTDVAWWTGPAAEAVALLEAQGDGALARLVAAADEHRRTMTDERHAADLHRTLVGAYLGAATPQGGSGFGGTDAEWRDARGVLADALVGLRPTSEPVTFLDHCCANGHLAISFVAWGAERGVRRRAPRRRRRGRAPSRVPGPTTPTSPTGSTSATRSPGCTPTGCGSTSCTCSTTSCRSGAGPRSRGTCSTTSSRPPGGCCSATTPRPTPRRSRATSG